MTTPEIADKLVALYREGKFEQIYAELYHPQAKSIEPAYEFGFTSIEGVENFPAKSAAFNAMIEEFHSFYVNDPIVAGNSFALATGYDATMKDAGRKQFDEIAVYQVKDGKIILEQFFY